MCSILAVVAASSVTTIRAAIVVSVINANCAIIAVDQLNSDCLSSEHDASLKNLYPAVIDQQSL